MKRLVMILTVVGVCMTLGCERRTGQAEEADRFDEKIDGPVCVLTVSADENLLADQRKISRQAKADAESVESEEKTDDEDTTASPTPAPAGNSISAVKQVLGDAIAAAKAKQYEQMMKVYADADAAAIKGLMSSAKQIPAKLETLEKLSQSKLGLPEGAMKLKIEVTIGDLHTPADDLADLDIDQLKFKTDGGNVVVTAYGNLDFTFVSTPSGWKLKMDPMERQMAKPIGDLFAGTSMAIDEITAGINSGDITRQNGKAKIDKIFEKHVNPAREKLDKLLEKIMRDTLDSTKPKPPVKPAARPRRRPEERRRPDEERRRRPDDERHRPERHERGR